jgi:hypothetical protein
MSRFITALAAFGLLTLPAVAEEARPRPQPAPRRVVGPKADAVLGSDRHAVIIGVNNYQDEAIPDLRMAEADAQAVYDVLTNSSIGGVPRNQATLLLGKAATTREVKRAINRLKTLPSRSTVFVYFSGHGMTESGDGFWLTQDAEANDLAASAVSDTDLRKFLGDIRAERLLVMIDACYASATVSGDRDAAKGLHDVLGKFTGKGHAVLSAAGNGEEALEANDLRHSVFTYYLLEGLRGKADDNRDGVVVLPELTGFLDQHVSDEAARRRGVQRPVVDMKSVQEPARFQIVIDAPRLAAVQSATAQAKAQVERRLLKLRELSLDEKLSVEQYREGKRLLSANRTTLSATDQAALKEYERVLDGQLAPEKLTKALELAADRPAAFSSEDLLFGGLKSKIEPSYSNAAAPSNAADIPNRAKTKDE